jgi:XTP/dITP diphosphohydrolase
MIPLLAATRNLHKVREIQEILGDQFDVQNLSASREFPETIESGKTFEENAILKALAISKRNCGLVIADDSGLEVDALGGAPGLFSARYAGEGATGEENIAKLLDQLGQTIACGERPAARFRCVIALARDGKLLATFDGRVEGRIVDTPRGREGFGYDPIFMPNGFNQTFAELSAGTKNQISHRAQALAGLKMYLTSDLANPSQAIS